MNLELKPCKECGGNAISTSFSMMGHIMLKVGCVNCDKYISKEVHDFSEFEIFIRAIYYLCLRWNKKQERFEHMPEVLLKK